MGVGVTNNEPLSAMRATLQIEDARVVDSQFSDQRGNEQKQFACVLRVVAGAGERDGETFSEWFSFPSSGAIAAKSKTGQVLTATLGPGATAETLEELASRLIGKRFAAQIGTSKDGRYSRVVHDTIGSADSGPTEAGQDAGSSSTPDTGSGPGTAGNIEEDDFKDIPF